MSVASSIDSMLKREHTGALWLPFYRAVVSSIGIYVLILAFISYDGDWAVLLLFAGMTIVTETASVPLFAKSQSFISLGYVLAIAAMLILGPWAAVLTHLVSSLALTATNLVVSKFQTKRKSPPKDLWVRVLFNVSMGAISAVCCGQIYIWAGGVPGATIYWQVILPLSLAVMADTFVNMVLLILLTTLKTGRKPLAVWLEDWQWAMPITIITGIVGGAGLAIAYMVAGSIGLILFILPIVATSYAFRLYVNKLRSYVDQLESANRQLDEANDSLLHTLGAVIDAYDLYTFGHSAQVARYADAIAEAMDLPVKERKEIVRGALIHDIGKVGVADAIIGKQGRLTDEEYAAMKMHTVIGAEIVSQMPLLQDLVPLVRNHHERWDGRGYPDGLKAKESPLAARILAVADSVEAMLSDRPYQATRSLEEVTQEVVRCAGQQYDPTVVAAFQSVVNTHGEEFFINSAAKIARELQNGEPMDVTHRIGYAKKSMVRNTVLVKV
ncbi:MAG: HD-GYP domain-containing protein [Caldilineaceae bacterium]|nr:HD-GYP domain-containing protein [Caldilineaceae bacterium]